MKGKYRDSRLIATLLLLLVVASLMLGSVEAQGDWYRDGRVLDMTGQVESDFIRQFNQASIASGHPIYLIIMGEEQLAGSRYTDEVALAIMTGQEDPALALGGWLPYDVVVISVAPYVEKSSSSYDYAITTLGYNGAHDRLGNTALAGHSDFVGVEIAEAIDVDVASGNWQQGVLSGVDLIAQASDQLGIGTIVAVPTPAPQVVVSQSPVVVIVPTSPPLVVVQKEPADTSWLGPVLLWALGLLAFFVAFFFGARFAIAVYQEYQKRQAAQQKARIAKQATAQRVNEVPGIYERVKQRVSDLANRVSAEDLNPLQQALAKANELIDRASIGFTDLGRSASDPDRPGLTVAEYQQLADTYSELLGSLKQAEGLLSRTEEMVVELEQAAEEVPEAINTASDDLKRAQEEMVTIKNQGYNCDEAGELLRQANHTLEVARKDLEEKRFTAAMARSRDVQALAEQVKDSARQESERHRILLAEAKKAEERLAGLADHIVLGETTLQKLQGTFAESCWDDVVRNPEQAKRKLAQCRELLAEVNTAIDGQEWDNAEAHLGQIHQTEQDAGWLIQTILDLKANLETAVGASSEELTAAETDIRKALAYIETHDPDIPEDLEEELSEAITWVEQARQMLAEEKPDYLEVVRLAKEANKTADQVVVEARSAVEAMDRALKSAQTELREANTAITSADSYIDDHSSDVDETARRNLKEARTLLEEAQEAMERAGRYGDEEQERRLKAYQECAEKADRAEQKAKDALTEAKDDVERARARRQRTTVTVTTYSSPSYSSPRRREPSTSSPTWSPSPSRPVSRPSSPSPSVSRPASRPSSSPSFSRPSSRPSSSPSFSRPSGRGR